MKTKKERLLVVFVTAITVALIAAGCFVEFEGDFAVAPPYGGGFSGKKTGSSKGYAGDVSVELTLKDGKITAVDVTHNETPNFGGVLIDKAKPLIIEYNSFVAVDGLSGATKTKNALIAAGNAALSGL